jgi:hypothetical protein
MHGKLARASDRGAARAESGHSAPGTAEIAPQVRPLHRRQAGGPARCQPITVTRRRSDGPIGRQRDANRAIRPGCPPPLDGSNHIRLRARVQRALALFSDGKATADGIIAWLQMSERATEGRVVDAPSRRLLGAGRGVLIRRSSPAVIARTKAFIFPPMLSFACASAASESRRSPMVRYSFATQAVASAVTRWTAASRWLEAWKRASSGRGPSDSGRAGVNAGFFRGDRVRPSACGFHLAGHIAGRAGPAGWSN